MALFFLQKPPEPEKKAMDKELDKKEVIEVRAPVVGPQLTRPPFESPLTTLEPRIADSLKENLQKVTKQAVAQSEGYVVYFPY